MRIDILECRRCGDRTWIQTGDAPPPKKEGYTAHFHDWWSRTTFEVSDRGPGLAPDQRAYYHASQRCWYVPVSAEMWEKAEAGELQPVEPARLELRDGQLWITPLEAAR